MTIGLFYGSFNPVHVGHLVLAESLVYAAGLQQVWMVLTPQSPFKQGDPALADAYQRLHLLHLATHNNPLLRPCDVELHLPAPHYTIQSLRLLQQRHPGHRFRLLMGEDNLTHLHRWREAEALLETGIVVYPRPGAEAPPDWVARHANVLRVNAVHMEISSSLVRQRLAAGQSVRYLLPEAVHEEVLKAGMYRPAPKAS